MNVKTAHDTQCKKGFIPKNQCAVGEQASFKTVWSTLSGDHTGQETIPLFTSSLREVNDNSFWSS